MYLQTISTNPASDSEKQTCISFKVGRVAIYGNDPLNYISMPDQRSGAVVKERCKNARGFGSDSTIMDRKG